MVPGSPPSSAGPVGLFDIVTCLDVLDTVEARFVDAVLDDIARRAGRGLCSTASHGRTRKDFRCVRPSIGARWSNGLPINATKSSTPAWTGSSASSSPPSPAARPAGPEPRPVACCLPRYGFSSMRRQTEAVMLYWALVFLIVAIIAGILGFGGVAFAAVGIAKLLFFVFLIVFLVMLVTGFVRRRPPPI
jgi:uncharacterized membrane protein YtjA (UPF0391 family)